MLYDIDKRRSRVDGRDNFWGNYTQHNFSDPSTHTKSKQGTPAVNIIEDHQEFTLELVSPGMCKQDYQLEVENDVLTITGTKNPDNVSRNYTRREYIPATFSKSFILPDTVDTDKISARCQDGILSILIPKKEEAYVTNKRDIKIT